MNRASFLIRLIFVLLSAALLMSQASAREGDYTVAYALQFGDKSETGKIVCNYEDRCMIESEKLKLTIHWYFLHADRREVRIGISGEKIGCCYFADGADLVIGDATMPLLGLQIYAGRQRKQNEYILNTPVGALYLSFQT